MDAEAFQREFMYDPYTAALSRVWIEAWALGHDHARRELHHADDPEPPSYVALRRKAEEALLAEQSKFDRDQIVALATVGAALPPELKRAMVR